jgi:hypothetical protein
MKFSETVKNADPDLVVSRQHDAWLESNDHPVYSPRALVFAREQLVARARNRTGTLSASSLGECPRYQQFVFLGMPQLPPDQKNAMKMHNGMFMHLRWQMAGLSAGWLAQAEVPVGENEFGLMGTMDGICYEESVLELKSINANGFSRVQTFGPLIPHLYQMATYLLCTERRKGVFVYECKDNQEYKEVVLGRDQLPIDEVVIAARLLRAEIAARRLYEPLNDCIDRKGWKYSSCPFRDRCLGIHTWEDV